MKYKYLFLMLLGLLFLQLTYAANLSFCQDLNEDYLNTTLYLENDFNLDLNQYCFTLDFINDDAGKNSYLEIDCNNYDLNRLTYNSEAFFLRVLDKIDKITLKNCNFNNSNIFRIENDLNTINVLDSNIRTSNILYSNYHHNNVDLNFTNSFLTNRITYQSILIFNFDFGVNNLNVYNLDVNFLESSNLKNIFNINNNLNKLSIYDSNFYGFIGSWVFGNNPTFGKGIFNVENVNNYLDLNIEVHNSNIFNSKYLVFYNLTDSNFKNIYINNIFDYNRFSNSNYLGVFNDNNTFFDNLYFYDINIIPESGLKYYKIYLLNLNDLENKDLNIFFKNCDFNTTFYLLNITNLKDVNLFFDSFEYDNNFYSYIKDSDIDIYISDSNFKLQSYFNDSNVNFYGDNNSTLHFMSEASNFDFTSLTVGFYDLNLKPFNNLLSTESPTKTNISIIDCNIYQPSNEYLFNFNSYVDLNILGTNFITSGNFNFMQFNKNTKIYNLNFDSVYAIIMNSMSNSNLNFYDSHILKFESWHSNFYLGLYNTDINYLKLNVLKYDDLNRSILDVNDSDLNYVLINDFKINSNSSFESLYNFNNVNDDFIKFIFEYNYGSSGVPHMFNLYDTNNLFKFVDSNIKDFYVVDFNLHNNANPNNAFYLQDSNIYNFNLQDSVLKVDSIVNVNENSYFNALIYNNIFYDYNLDNEFVIDNGSVNIDFNTNLQNNRDKRTKILDDFHNNIGGNLWLDTFGNNFCSRDYNNDGICDNNKPILLSSSNYLYDNYPLISSFSMPDLNVHNISLSSNKTGNINVICEYVNSGNSAINNYSVSFYVNDVLITSKSIGNELLPNELGSTTFIWNVTTAGDYNLKCFIPTTDSDMNNNTLIKTFNIIASSSKPPVLTYDLISNLSLSSNTLSKFSNVVITPNISKSGRANFESAEYKIYIYDKSNTKIELFSDTFTDSDLPITNTYTLTLEDLLTHNILDLVTAEGKLTLYLEVISSNDREPGNNISYKPITIKYFEANLKESYLNNSLLQNNVSLDLEDNDYTLDFGFEYIAINTTKNLVFNLKSNKQLLYTKQIPMKNLIDENEFDDTINLNLLDFVNESDAKKLILNIYKFDLNNSIHREKYFEILTNLGISLDGSSFAGKNYYLELELKGQEFSDNSENKVDIDFYTSFNIDASIDIGGINDIENVEEIEEVKETKETKEGKEGGGSQGEKSITYFLKYKSKIGLDENQIIYLYDDKNNFASNVDVTIKFNDDLYFFKTDSLGTLIYTPDNDGNYDISVKQLGLNGKFQVVYNYISSDKDYIVFENALLFGESKKTNYIYYIIPAIFFIILLVLGGIFFYPKKKSKDYDFTLTKNYLKSEFYEKIQLEQDIKKAQLDASHLKQQIKKNEFKYEYKPDNS